MLLQSYVLKNDKLIIDVRERLSQYNGSLKFKVISDKEIVSGGANLIIFPCVGLLIDHFLSI